MNRDDGQGNVKPCESWEAGWTSTQQIHKVLAWCFWLLWASWSTPYSCARKKRPLCSSCFLLPGSSMQPRALPPANIGLRAWTGPSWTFTDADEALGCQQAQQLLSLFILILPHTHTPELPHGGSNFTQSRSWLPQASGKREDWLFNAAPFCLLFSLPHYSFSLQTLTYSKCQQINGLGTCRQKEWFGSN